MAKELTLESAISLWSEFYGSYKLGPAIREVASSWPDLRSVEVSYKTLILYSPGLAEFLLERPHQACYSADEAAVEGLPPALKCPLRIRFTELPKDRRTSPRIRDIRSSHLGSLLRLQGVVRKRTEVRPMIKEAVFQCLRCGAAIEMSQDGQTLKEPIECYEDQGGCKRAYSSTKFLLLMGPASLLDPFEAPREGRTLRFSETVDAQTVELCEEADTLKGGEQPEKLSIRLQSDLVGKLLPGEHVVINGVLREAPRSVGGAKSTIFEVFLDALSLEREGKEDGEVEFEPEEIAEFQAFAEKPDAFETMTRGIAPSIYGLEREKEGLLLQLFGGVPKELAEGTRIRGDIHVLLVGDPGIAKSQLLRYMASVCPRALYTSGKSSSAAGLTAAAVKDGDSWALEAGALVLANGGLCCVDEIDKMNPTDRDSMHEAMEQQTVSVAKAGMAATLQARTSILGAGNPKLGRFDPHQGIGEQIDLPAALLSRFDLIFAIADKPERVRDADMALHVLRTHSGNALSQSATTIAPAFLKRFVRYAKELKPGLVKEASDRIKDYYVEIRKQGEGDAAAVPMTARNLEGLIRLSEASAKTRLSNVVELKDAERAINLTEFYLRKIAGASGGLDIDVIAVGVSKVQREVARTLLNIVKASDNGGGVLEDEVVNSAIKEGVDERKARDMLHRLREQGDLYQPDARHYKVSPT